MLRTPGNHEHSVAWPHPRVEGVQDPTSLTPERLELQCLPQGLLFSRPWDIPGCAMSDPGPRPVCDGAGRDQLAVPLFIRKGEFLNERRPNTIQYSRSAVLNVNVS